MPWALRIDQRSALAIKLHAAKRKDGSVRDINLYIVSALFPRGTKRRVIARFFFGTCSHALTNGHLRQCNRALPPES